MKIPFAFAASGFFLRRRLQRSIVLAGIGFGMVSRGIAFDVPVTSPVELKNLSLEETRVVSVSRTLEDWTTVQRGGYGQVTVRF